MGNNTVDTIKKRKNKRPITMITAYDYLFASLFDSKVDMILVGDSLSMSFGGDRDTLSITLEQMLYHTKAVCKGARESLVVFDMPFGYYESQKSALKNAMKVYKKSDAKAIKIEGGREKSKIVSALVNEKIAVMGHIGLMPQCVRADGGYKIKGKVESEEQKLLDDAKALEDSGAFALVLEGIRGEVAAKITNSISIPTIGIGSGVETDGQVLVWSDMLGFFKEFKPKFVREYLDGATLVESAILRYVDDVTNRNFPGKEETY